MQQFVFRFFPRYTATRWFGEDPFHPGEYFVDPHQQREVSADGHYIGVYAKPSETLHTLYTKRPWMKAQVYPSGSDQNPDPHGLVGDKYKLEFERKLSFPLAFPGGPPWVKRNVDPGI